MKTTTKFALALVVLLVAVGTVASQFVKVRLPETRLSQHTQNAGELTRDVLVGQTFVAQKDNLSGLGVMFATYSGRNNTGLVKFHLRQGFDAKEDLRVAMVDPSQLGDNRLYRFDFAPIPDSAGKTYFFFVVSPDGISGRAVTVDLNTQDPYYLGTAFIVRDKGSAITDPAVLAASGKPTVDVVFETYHTVTAREAVWVKTQGFVRTLIGTWPEKKSMYWLWARLALAPALFLLSVIFVRRGTGGLLFWLPILLIAAFGFRLWYAANLPVTNDEGNYLYDAWTLLFGKLAGGDGYVKAPLVVAWLAVWEFILGHSVLAGRLASVAVGALTLLPVYFLGRGLFGKKTGLIGATAWAFFGSSIVFDIYVHTQPVALLLAISGLAALLWSLKTRPKQTMWFVIAGALLGLGVASRKSVLAVGLVPIVLVLGYGQGLRMRGKQLVSVGIGFGLVMAAFLGLAFLTYGTLGIWEALGVNSAEDGLNISQEDAALVRAYSIRGMTPFFRESLALIWLALIGFGVAAERAIRSIFQYLKARPSREIMLLLDKFLPKIGWIPALIVFTWCWKFFHEYEGQAFHVLGIPILWPMMGFGLLIVALMPRLEEDRLQLPERADIVPKSTQPLPNSKFQIPNSLLANLAAALTGLVWVWGLVFFYTNWIKFHANYIAEFIPPLILLAAVGVMHLFDRLRAPLFLSSDYPPVAVLRKLLVGGAVAVMFWAIFTGNYITFVYEHTGTFQQGSVAAAAAWAREHIPPSDPIFTGAAVIPYVSGHRVSLDIAHPRWYAYGFTRKDVNRLNTFLPPADQMVQAFRDAKWFLNDQQTAFSFLNEYDDIARGLQNDFVAVKQIENGGNPLTFYQRVR